MRMQAAKTKVVGQYAGEMVYVVREVHTPAEVMELTLYPGDHVALLKNKDPLGRTDRWFVDDGGETAKERCPVSISLHCFQCFVFFSCCKDYVMCVYFCLVIIYFCFCIFYY